MSRPVIAAWVASVFALYGLIQSGPEVRAAGTLRAWEQELTGIAAGLTGQSSATRLHYRGSKQGLAFRLVAEGSNGEVLREARLGSVHKDAPLRLDHVAVVSIEDLQGGAGETRLLTVRLASLSGDDSVRVHAFVDEWMPAGGSGSVAAGFGAARAVSEDLGLTLFELVFSDRSGRLRLELVLET